MNPVDWAIRQHIFEQLQSENCIDLRLGISDWKDCSYKDYSEAIGFKLNTSHDSPKIKILVNDCLVRCILVRHIMNPQTILRLDIDPTVPEFKQLNGFYRALIDACKPHEC